MSYIMFLGNRQAWYSMLAGALTLSFFASSAFAQLPSLGGSGSGLPNVGSKVGPATGPVIGPNIGPSIGPRLGPGVNTGPTLGPTTVRQPALSPNVNHPVRAAADTATAVDQQANAGWTLAAQTNGVKINQIETGSMAAKAGFQVGDTIRAVNRSWVRSQADLASQLQAAAAADGRAWVLVDRGGRQEWVDLNFATQAPATLGADIQEQNGAVIVKQVHNGSVAALAGLKTGDQIVSLNGKAISTEADYATQLQAAASGNREVLIQLRRNGALYQARATLERAAQQGTNVVAEAKAKANGVQDNVAERVDMAVNDAKNRVDTTVEDAKNRVGALRNEIRDRLDAAGNAIQSTKAAAIGRVDNAIASAKGNVSAVRDEIGDQKHAALARLDAALDHVHDRVADLRGATGELKEEAFTKLDNAVATARRRVEDVRDLKEESVARLHTSIDAVQARATELRTGLQNRVATAVEKVGEVRENVNARVEALKVRVDEAKQAAVDRVDATADRVADRARELKAEVNDGVASATAKLGEAKDRSIDLANAKVGDLHAALHEAKDGLAIRVDHLRKMADDLHNKVNMIPDKTQAVAREKAELARRQIAEIKAEFGDLLEAKREAVAEKLASLKGKVAATEKHLTDFVKDVSGDVRQEVEATLNVVVRLHADLDRLK